MVISELPGRPALGGVYAHLLECDSHAIRPCRSRVVILCHLHAAIHAMAYAMTRSVPTCSNLMIDDALGREARRKPNHIYCYHMCSINSSVQ